jgi:hypothetical protein
MLDLLGTFGVVMVLMYGPEVIEALLKRIHP